MTYSGCFVSTAARDPTDRTVHTTASHHEPTLDQRLRVKMYFHGSTSAVGGPTELFLVPASKYSTTGTT